MVRSYNYFGNKPIDRAVVSGTKSLVNYMHQISFPVMNRHSKAQIFIFLIKCIRLASQIMNKQSKAQNFILGCKCSDCARLLAHLQNQRCFCCCECLCERTVIGSIPVQYRAEGVVRKLGESFVKGMVIAGGQGVSGCVNPVPDLPKWPPCKPCGRMVFR